MGLIDTLLARLAPARSADPASSETSSRANRLGMAAFTALIAATWIGPYWAAAWLAAILTHDLLLSPFVTANFITPQLKNAPLRARAREAVLIGFGSIIFAAGWVPAYLTGAPGSAYFAGVWMACTIIHGLIHSRKDPLLFIAFVLPALVAALIAPLLLHGLSLLALVLVLVTMRLGYSAFTALRDRFSLLDTVKENRAQLKAAEGANAAKSEFLATMSHELRTPLNAVIGYAEILEEDLAENGANEASRTDAGRIHRSARGLLSMIDEVLDYAKIDSGDLVLRQDNVDISALIRDVVQSFAPEARAGGNALEASMVGSLGALTLDAARLRQCIDNLVSNACQFTKGGTIRIEAQIVPRGDQQALCISVSDTGIGIAAEDQARLFRPFTQIDSTKTRAQDGTGLGLALTRRLAELMGGGVSLESMKGVGSRFTLNIAARRAAPAAANSNTAETRLAS